MENNQSKIDYLLNVIDKDYRHKYYNRVVALAADYKAFITGEGLDAKLKQFVRREDEEAFKQRVAITKHILPALTNNLMAVFQKAIRSYDIKKYYNSENENILKSFQEVEEQFYNDKPVDYYLSLLFNLYTHLDPNSFVIAESDGTDGLKYATTYPFYVKSSEAIDYKYINSILQYLTVMQISIYEAKNGSKSEMHTYTYYDKLQAIKLTQLNAEQIEALPMAQLPKENKETTIINGNVCYNINKNFYILSIPEPYNLSFVPAMQVGYIPDPLTDFNTYVNPFHIALSYLEKLLKTVSEMDISMVLHCFPQKIEYVSKCDYLECSNGILPDGKQCKVCGGTGIKPTHTTGMDTLQLAMPDSPQEVLSINNLIGYVSLPIDILQFQDGYIDKLIKQAKISVFNADTFSRQEVATVTATEKNIDLQNVYDTVYPFALKYCEMWESLVYYTADYMQLANNIEIYTKVPKDFKFKTFEDLLIEMRVAKEAGASTLLVKSIEDDIMTVRYQDSPQDLQKYKVKKIFEPFKNKTNEELVYLLGTLPADNYYRVLHIFFDIIFEEIEVQEGEIFYAYTKEKQTEILKTFVEKYVKEIKGNQSLNIGE